MRGFLLSFLLSAVLVSALPAVSHIVSDGTLPDDVLSSLAEDIGEETYGRGDLRFTASGYSESEEENGFTEASMLLSFSGKEILLSFRGEDREALLESLGEETRSLLFYEPSLSSDGEMKPPIIRTLPVLRCHDMGERVGEVMDHALGVSCRS